MERPVRRHHRARSHPPCPPIGDRVSRALLGKHEDVGITATFEDVGTVAAADPVEAVGADDAVSTGFAHLDGVERNVVDGIEAKAKRGVVGGDVLHHGQASVEEVVRDDEVGQVNGRLTVAYDDAEATLENSEGVAAGADEGMGGRNG